MDKGDYVIIRNDITEHRFPRDPGITRDMLKMRGKTYMITGVSSKGNFLINGRFWHPKWLELENKLSVTEDDLVQMMKE